MGELDINIGDLKKHAFRVSKHRGETAARIRIPGGAANTKVLQKIVEIADKYGDGTVNITNRQGVEIPGIRLEDMDAVKLEIQPIIDEYEIVQGAPISKCLNCTTTRPIRTVGTGHISISSWQTTISFFLGSIPQKTSKPVHKSERRSLSLAKI